MTDARAVAGAKPSWSLTRRWSASTGVVRRTLVVALVVAGLLAPASVTAGATEGPGQASALSENGCFVVNAFEVFLDRAPTDAEIAAWEARFAAGDRRSLLPDELANSDEWLGVVVEGLYQQALDRSADPEGEAFWIAQLRSGTLVNRVGSLVYGSPEFYANAGGTDEGFVTDLYDRILFRTPDQAGLDFWVGQIDTRGRGRVAASFFASIESRTTRVSDLYQRVLGRGPDPSGLEFWVGRLRTVNDVALAVLLASSVEFFERSQTLCPTTSGLFAWGFNGEGRTGLGTGSGSTLVPTQVDTSTDWASLAAGLFHSLGVRTDGTLWAWGSNGNGRTGFGTDSGSTLVPTQVGTASNWASVAAGSSSSLAVRTDGTLWAWGWNANGQTGLGTDSGNTLVPTQVGTATDWASVTAGSGHALALRTDGTLWAWGLNDNGRTGLDPGSGNTLVPTQVGTGTDWDTVAAGSLHSLGVRTDGTLWAWGSNGTGQTGRGLDSGNTLVPAQVGTATDWDAVAAGSFHSAALRTDGTLWAWGNNGNGRTGIGTDSGNTLVPTQAGTATDWATVAASGEYSLAIRTDGTLWAWGNNGNGRTGLGTDSGSTLVPTRVGTATNWASVFPGAGHAFGARSTA